MVTGGLNYLAQYEDIKRGKVVANHVFPMSGVEIFCTG
jgi:hypothetical protein